MSNITIYHNPACGTSRNTLEMIRNSGTEPTIIHYLETPPTRDERKRAARTVLTGMCYSVGSATRQGSSSPTRFIGQSAMTSST